MVYHVSGAALGTVVTRISEDFLRNSLEFPGSEVTLEAVGNVGLLLTLRGEPWGAEVALILANVVPGTTENAPGTHTKVTTFTLQATRVVECGDVDSCERAEQFLDVFNGWAKSTRLSYNNGNGVAGPDCRVVYDGTWVDFACDVDSQTVA